MKIGTKSLLFGIHQVLWHPFVVYRAWKNLYGRPSWKEFVCIFIHDWGYWGKPNLDGREGIDHPRLGAIIAFKLFGRKYWELCAGHSRSYVQAIIELDILRSGPLTTSKLCWADKLSIIFEPPWFYYWRAKLSGEWDEVVALSHANGLIKEDATYMEWYAAYSKSVVATVMEETKKEGY